MTTRVANVGPIASYIESLPDTRHTRNRKHLFLDIVVSAMYCRVCGSDGPTAIHCLATHRAAWLNESLARLNGIRSRDCFRIRSGASGPRRSRRASGTGPPDRAERVQRRAVLWWRSFGYRSAAGCRFVERVLTVVETPLLQKRPVLEFLAKALQAQRAGLQAPSLVEAG